MKPAVFLDRDGVINKVILDSGRPFSPRKIAELQIIEGVEESVALMKEKGFEVVVITNQPDLARGYITQSMLMEMHEIISQSTGINNFYFCGHDDSDNCVCRKPKAGMLLKAALELKLNLKESFLVGDRWKDISAGQEVGCSCFFIDYNYQEPRPNPPFYRVTSLYEAALIITGSNYGI
jgi:D-glycero-D-manno-heptose 1,7-bisphosphate phosphatase